MKYDLVGLDGEPPIVLVPGGLSGWISWKPHAEILSKSHRVIRVQLLNMAAAEEKRTPPDSYSLRMESEALKNTLDKLQIKKINLVGWSHGGAVSLDFSLNHPGYLKTLTLIEPASYWVARALHQHEDETRVFSVMLKSFREPATEEDLIRFLNANSLVPPEADPHSMPQWPVWSSLKTALLSLHTVMEHDDRLERLRRIKGIPILLVRGRESRGFNSGIVDLLAGELGVDVKVLDLPDGHACHIVARDEFIAELEKFLG